MDNNSGWEEVKLGQVATEITVGYVGPMVDEYAPSGVPFLRSQNVKPFRLELNDLIHINEEFHHRLRKSSLSPGDVVIVRTGAPGVAAVIPDTLPVANCADLVIVRPGQKLDPRFLVYYINSVAQRHILSHVVGAVQQHFNVTSARTLTLRLPALAEQQAISHVLGMLDEKIELNGRMNRTLEAMAGAIFRSWFVEFDPVVARAEGRAPYGMSAETAALFPDGFEESEVGAIPRGWKAGRIGDIAANVRRIVGPDELDSTTPYIGLEHMPRKSIALNEWATAGEIASSKFAFEEGEILFGKLRPYFHKVGVAPLDGVCSTDILVVKPKLPEWRGLVLGYLSSTEFIDYTDAGSEGTRMPRTSWDRMARYAVVIPIRPVGRAFSQVSDMLVAKIRNGIFESRLLADVRDLLLPRLLSGQIRVRQAEKMAEETL